MKLHIGCFNQPLKGWHNTDITPHIFISRIPLAATLLRAVGKMTEERLNEHKRGVFRQVHHLDVTKTFPFPTDSVSAVFSSHIIEHLHADDARKMLEESLRVLEPGGVCRVVAPSLEWAFSFYDETSPEETLGIIFEHGQTGKNRHQWMYTAKSLIRLMEEVGYTKVTQQEYREGNLPDVQQIDNRPENSIYVEGTKA